MPPSYMDPNFVIIVSADVWALDHQQQSMLTEKLNIIIANLTRYQ